MVVINPSDDVEARAAVKAAYDHVGPVYPVSYTHLDVYKRQVCDIPNTYYNLWCSGKLVFAGAAVGCYDG